MIANTQGHSAARRGGAKSAPRAPERTKGETVPPVAVLQLIDKVGVTVAHRMLGISTTTLHKARKTGAVVSRVIELASEAKLRELEQDGGAARPVSAAAPRVVTPGNKRLVVLKMPEEHVEDLEQIARAWGAEFTKA